LPWYKGNLHAHSFWSDGCDFPEMIADWFKRHGYHFLAFTEHDTFQTGDHWLAVDASTYAGRTLAATDCLARYQQRFGDGHVQTRMVNGQTEVRLKPMDEYRGLIEDERFRLLQGEEVTHDSQRDEAIYLNVFNHDQPMGAQRGETAPDAIAHTAQLSLAAQDRLARPVLTAINHPNWHYRVHADWIIEAAGVRFMEVFTALSSCNVYGDADHPDAETLWDTALAARLSRDATDVLLGLFTDDCHFYLPDDPHVLERRAMPGDGLGFPGRAWVMVHADHLDDDAIFTAMTRGAFYGSTGVTLDAIETDGKTFSLDITTEPGTRYLTQFITTRKHGATGEIASTQPGAHPRYTFTGDERYVRARIVSDRVHPMPHRAGDTQCAWTQPIVPS